jgi:undecaprenyl pyrophosphate phosphatase UppP
MNPRTKLAIIQDLLIGAPTIAGISIFNGIDAGASALVHTLGSAVIGFAISFIMLYASLKWFRVKSKYDVMGSSAANSQEQPVKQ